MMTQVNDRGALLPQRDRGAEFPSADYRQRRRPARWRKTASICLIASAVTVFSSVWAFSQERKAAFISSLNDSTLIGLEPVDTVLTDGPLLDPARDLEISYEPDDSVEEPVANGFTNVELFEQLFDFSAQAVVSDAIPDLDEDGIPAGHMIIEGDVIVPQRTILTVYEQKLWPGGVVPYAFDQAVTSTNQVRAVEAMLEWEAVTPVRFVPLAAGHDDYIVFYNSVYNSSYIGMRGGAQPLNIRNWARKFIIAHELGHALGLHHEQRRTDRHSYVEVIWENICQDCCNNNSSCDHNFEVAAGSEIYPMLEADILVPAADGSGFERVHFSTSPYDFDSVMHYSQFLFSVCSKEQRRENPEGCRTLRVRPPYDADWQDAIGQSDHLSLLDGLTVAYMYHIETLEHDPILLDNGGTLVDLRDLIVLVPADPCKSPDDTCTEDVECCSGNCKGNGICK